MEKENLFIEIAKRIAEETSCLTKFIANTLLEKDHRDNGIYNCAYLYGDCGFDDIINKNYYIANNMNMALNMEIILLNLDNKLEEDLILDKLDKLLKYISNDLCYKMYPFLVTINNILDHYTDNAIIDISPFRPDLNTWNNISDYFGVDKYHLGNRTDENGRNIHYIYIDYKGLAIPILECVGSIVFDFEIGYLTKIEPIRLNPIYYYNLYNTFIFSEKNKINENIIKNYNILATEITKIEKYISDLIIENSKNPLEVVAIDKDNELINILSNPLFMYDKRLFIGRYIGTSNDVSNYYVNKYTDIINEDNTKNIYKSINCYTFKGDRDINNSLLQKAMFGIEDLYNKNYQDDIGNPNCTGFSPKQILEYIHQCMDSKLLELVKNDSFSNNQDMIFTVTRYTYPSMYDNKVIESFKVGDILTIPTLVSTSYLLDGNPFTYTTYNSPMVIFHITISKYMCNNFIFIENVSNYKNEHEVLLREGLTYKIIDIHYERVSVTYNKVIQKLNIYLVIQGDAAAEQYLTNIIKTDKYWTNVDNFKITDLNRIPLDNEEHSDNKISGGNINKSVAIPYLYLNKNNKSTYKTLLDTVELNDSDKANTYFVFPDIPQVQKEYMKTGVYKKIEPDLLDLIPGYLRKNKGFRLKNKINGCEFVDPTIVNLIPSLKNIIVSNSVVYDTTVIDLMTKLDNYLNNIFYTLSKNDQQKFISEYYFSSKIMEKYKLPIRSENKQKSNKSGPYKSAITVSGGSQLVIGALLILCCILIIYLICILFNNKIHYWPNKYHNICYR